MEILYPKPVRLNRTKPDPPPIAPTYLLRADAAISEAHRYFSVAIAQAFGAILWLASFTLVDNFKLGALDTFINIAFFVSIAAAFLWASMQGMVFGTPRYSSGEVPKVNGFLKYRLIGIFLTLALSVIATIALYLLWQKQIFKPPTTTVTPLLAMLILMLSAIFSALRGATLLKYAQSELAKNSPT